MDLSVRPAARLSAASKLVEDIFYKRDVYYLFFGKTDTWPGTVDIPSDQPSMSESAERIVRGSSIFFKKVESSDVSLAIPRYNWESGTVFTEWDDTIDMLGKNFFVLADSYRIYKCLDNNRGAPSTIEPKGTSFDAFKTSDGYIWKYMYTIPPSKRTRFLATDKIPVQRAFTDSFYNNGSIEKVLINSGGAGYVMAPITTMSVSGATSGSGAVMSIGTIDGDGAITSITVTNGGSGYAGSCDLTIAGSGTGAILTPVFSGGEITSLTITNAGSGYTAGSAITTSVGGATVIPVISNGSVEDVIITNPGSGYTGTPTIAIGTTGPTPNGKYPGHSTALFQALMLNGRLDRVAILDPGVGYEENYTTTITPVGDGYDASFIPVVDGGEIIDVYVANPGYGYSSATLNVSSTTPPSQVASLTAVVAEFDMSTDQSIVEQSAIDGAIHLIKPIVEGTGYEIGTTTAEIIGDGVGATCVPVVVDGKIVQYTVTNIGSGYTYANVVLTNTARSAADPSQTLYVNATARVVIPPTGGHGKNAPIELMANSAMITTSLRGVPVLSLIDQEFRQYGLARNLRTLLSNSRATTLQSYEAYITEFSATNLTNLIADSVVKNDAEEEYRVIYKSGTTVHLAPMGSGTGSPVGVLYPKEGGDAYECLSVSSSPTINKYSGDVYFVSNESPFVVDESNGIFIRTHITF